MYFYKISGVTVIGLCAAPSLALEYVHLTVLTFRLAHEALMLLGLHEIFTLVYTGKVMLISHCVVEHVLQYAVFLLFCF